MPRGICLAVNVRVTAQTFPFVCHGQEELALISYKRTGWKSNCFGIPWVVTPSKRNYPNPSRETKTISQKGLQLQFKCTDIFLFALKSGNPEFRRDTTLNPVVLMTGAGWEWGCLCLLGSTMRKRRNYGLKLNLVWRPKPSFDFGQRCEMGRKEQVGSSSAKVQSQTSQCNQTA